MSNNAETDLSAAIGKLSDQERRRIMKDAGVAENQIQGPISDQQISNLAAARPDVGVKIVAGAAQAGQLAPSNVQRAPSPSPSPSPTTTPDPDPDPDAQNPEAPETAEGTELDAQDTQPNADTEPSLAPVEDWSVDSTPDVSKRNSFKP